MLETAPAAADIKASTQGTSGRSSGDSGLQGPDPGPFLEALPCHFGRGPEVRAAPAAATEQQEQCSSRSGRGSPQRQPADSSQERQQGSKTASQSVPSQSAPNSYAPDPVPRASPRANPGAGRPGGPEHRGSAGLARWWIGGG